MESALFLGGASGMAQAGLILPVSHNCDAVFFMLVCRAARVKSFCKSGPWERGENRFF
jgi:hypothetical protein